MCGTFKFCFLELSGIFFPNISDPQLVESAKVEPAGCISLFDSKGLIQKWAYTASGPRRPSS